MLIHLSREEIINIIEGRFRVANDIDGKADIGFVDGDLVGVLAVGECLPDLFDTDETDPEPKEEGTRNTFEAKGAAVKPAKRKRRTRAEIEADEAKQKAEEANSVTPVENDADKPPFDTDPVTPTAAEVAAQEETAKPVEEEPNPFAEAEATPKQESDEEADPANEDNPFADAGATPDPFASSSEPASDTNFFSVDGNTSEEFNKPAEDNQDVFKLFD